MWLGQRERWKNNNRSVVYATNLEILQANGFILSCKSLENQGIKTEI